VPDGVFLQAQVVPFQVADVNYWLSGETPSLIPDDYFTNCQAMLQYQVGKIERHLETYEDDYIPFLFPWYGTGVIPSAIGAEILFQPKMDPAVRGTVLASPDQVRRLTLPDPQQDGLMPRVLETIRYFRAQSDLPISFTDPQGPFTTALTLVGPETLFVWLYEYPRAVHELMEFCTEVFIRWIKAQKQVIGEERGRCCFPHGIILPEQFGKVWLCDIEPYHDELFSNLRRSGTIVASFVAPEMALNKGKHEIVSRNGNSIAGEAYACLRRHCSGA
jgi:hypothetical protein